MECGDGEENEDDEAVFDSLAFEFGGEGRYSMDKVVGFEPGLVFLVVVEEGLRGGIFAGEEEIPDDVALEVIFEVGVFEVGVFDDGV